MTRRRARGEGTVRRRDDGRFEARVTVGFDELGRQVRRSIYGATEAAVVAELDALRRRPVTRAAADRITVAEYLAEWYRYRTNPPDGVPLKPTTACSYRLIIDAYIVPALGRRRLAAIRPLDVQRLLGDLADRGLAVRSVRNVRNVLSSAFRTAVEWELVPASPVVRPAGRARREREAPAAWSAAELVRFLEAARRHRLYPLFYLMSTTGIREGEALALRRDDLDLGAATLRIRRTVAFIPGRGLVESTPKTERGRRVVALPADTVAILEAHLERVKADRKAAAELWREAGLLFPSTVGTHVYPRNLIRVFADIVERATVPRLTPHGLRHTYASLALRGGLALRDLSDRLGHYDPAFTLSVYTHVLPDAPNPARTLAELTVGAEQVDDQAPAAPAAAGERVN